MIPMWVGYATSSLKDWNGFVWRSCEFGIHIYYRNCRIETVSPNLARIN